MGKSLLLLAHSILRLAGSLTRILALCKGFWMLTCRLLLYDTCWVPQQQMNEVPLSLLTCI